MIIIIRNGKDYGPYDEATVAAYVSRGRLLLHDRARDAATGREDTVGNLLRLHGLRPRVSNAGSLTQQLRMLGADSVCPRQDLTRSGLRENRRLLLLAVVGLGLSAIMMLPISGYLVFYAVSLYFATVWGLFFAWLFSTHQVRARVAVTTFFLTQLGVFLIFGTLHSLNFFYIFTRAAFPLSMVGYILGVGLTEEFAKQVPLYVLQRRSREPLLPETFVFYGLIAGLAFGVFEGVEYQTTVNAQADYTTAFVLNIARLTSLPFIHAVWCGIGGYFLGMAGLYPRFRRSMWLLALAVPATLHGLYDTFASTTFGYILALATAVVSVVLLTAYLRRSGSLRQRLRNE